MQLRSLGILVTLVAVVGCAHMSLKDQAVREIRVQSIDAGLCPGEEARIAVTAVMTDGREEATTGAGHGKVGWKNYQMSFSGGTAKDGKVRLSSDPRLTWTEPALLQIAAADHPDVQWQGRIAVRYDCTVQADFSGAPGSNGSSGSSGREGDSPGGRGNDGGDGSTGDHGEHGESIEAWVTTVTGPGQQTLVQAAVEGNGARSFYAFDPARGTLTLDTSGGAGGTGGAGGNGGRGGHAEKDVRQGRGGDGGAAACGGDGGDGGDILLHLDPQARPYLDRVLMRTGGGDGGSGGVRGSGGKGSPRGRDGNNGCTGQDGRDGREQTRDEDVAPLW